MSMPPPVPASLPWVFKPGWWKVRHRIKTPIVPAMIGLCQHEPGEPDNLLERPYWVAAIAGRPVDPYAVLQCGWHEPISEAEYRYLVADMAWTKEYDPHDPRHKPRRKVNLADLPPVGPGEE